MRALAFVLMLLVPSMALADDPMWTESRPLPAPGKLHGMYRGGMVLRVNPLGLFVSATLMARTRLYASDSMALRDNYLAFGGTTIITPAFARVGAMLEVQPLSVLQINAAYELIGFFKTFEFMQSYPSASADSSDTQLKALKAAGTNYATLGGIFTLGATLQLKVGPIALKSAFRALLYDMKLRDGDRVWYDSTLDIVSPKNGWVITDDTDLLFVTKFGFVAGARYSVTHSVMNAESYAAGETPSAAFNPVTHRLGPFFAYTFYDREGAKFNAPTLVLIAQWWLNHRYRTGQDVKQAIPWLVIAFTYKGSII